MIGKYMLENNNVRMGVRDGIPIAVGYFTMSFAFGLFAASFNLGVLEATFISMFNLTSAGQMTAVPIIAEAGSLITLALTQFIINARYALMSISLSQRLGESVKLSDRFLIAFFNTDEIFAFCCTKETKIGKKYLYAIAVIPYVAWTLGTLVGARAGEVLPEIFVNALSVMLYAMFIAILMPAVKASLSTALCVLVAAAVSAAFHFIPMLKEIPMAVVVIISAVVISAIFAIAAPIEDPDPWREEDDYV